MPNSLEHLDHCTGSIDEFIERAAGMYSQAAVIAHVARSRNLTPDHAAGVVQRRWPATALSDRERVQACLDFIKTGHDCATHWIQEVYAEARQLGLMPERADLGCNCPREPYREPLYGGDLADAF